MGLLRIDEEKCKRDEFCVRECPTAIIRLSKNEGIPEIVPGGEGNCLDCGHCVAVCPHDALSHVRIKIEDCPLIRKELQVNEEQALQFLRSRRSVRRFLDKPVEREKIQRLIEGARYSPTAGNSQLVQWLVLTDKKRIAEIAAMTVDWLREVLKDPRIAEASPYLPMVIAAWDAGNDSVLRGTPALIVASAPKEAINGTVDLTIALSYLDLLAPAMGLGTCWAGLLQAALLSSSAIYRAVGIPDRHPHHYPMMLGYPELRYYRLPQRRAPKIRFA